MSLLDTQTPDHSTTSFDVVVIQKETLLTELKKNRDNHQAIYDAAVQGYWQKASEVVAEKDVSFQEALGVIGKDFIEQKGLIEKAIQDRTVNKIPDYMAVSLRFDSRWPLAYPVNHLEDYDHVISMMEFSVADKVKLSAQDFNAYVRNNWKWKDQFTSLNQGYVCAVSGALFSSMLDPKNPLSEPNSPVYRFAARGETQ